MTPAHFSFAKGAASSLDGDSTSVAGDNATESFLPQQDQSGLKPFGQRGISRLPVFAA
jgi:hypothetical protein